MMRAPPSQEYSKLDSCDSRVRLGHKCRNRSSLNLTRWLPSEMGVAKVRTFYITARETVVIQSTTTTIETLTYVDAPSRHASVKAAPATARAGTTPAATLDFSIDVPVSMLLEPSVHAATMSADLEAKLLSLATSVANQGDTIVMLSENQRRIDQLRALALVLAPLCTGPPCVLACATAPLLTLPERRPASDRGGV